MIYCCSCFVLRMPRFLTMCMLWRTSKAWWGFNIHIWTLIIFDTFCKCLKIHDILLDLNWSAFQALCTYWKGSALCILGAASSQNEWSPCHLNRGTTYILHVHTALVYTIAGFPSVTVCTCKICAAPLFRYHGECMSPGKDAILIAALLANADIMPDFFLFVMKWGNICTVGIIHKMPLGFLMFIWVSRRSHNWILPAVHGKQPTGDTFPVPSCSNCNLKSHDSSTRKPGKKKKKPVHATYLLIGCRKPE